MPKNESHLTNRSLLTMSELTKIGQGHRQSEVKSLLNNIARMWPGARQVFYDLMAYKDHWLEASFSYDKLSFTGNGKLRLIEIRLSIVFRPEASEKMLSIINTWPTIKAPDYYTGKTIKKHSNATHRKFYGENGDYANVREHIEKNNDIMHYEKWWYPELTIKSRKV